MVSEVVCIFVSGHLGLWKYVRYLYLTTKNTTCECFLSVLIAGGYGWIRDEKDAALVVDYSTRPLKFCRRQHCENLVYKISE